MADESRGVSRYWDENRSKAHDPAFWMAHPLCREAINRRVTGSPHEWPLDAFRRVFGSSGFGHAVSWGCGLGAFERAVVRMGLVSQIDAFDVSPASLEDARRLADEEGLRGIRYALGNFDDPEIPDEPYDIAFFHASLHHVSALERLFRRLTLALRPGGGIYVDEYIGPSRTEWRIEKLELAESLMEKAPAEGKLQDRIPLPIQLDDPSEAIRSSEIEGFLRAFFEIQAWCPYGGQVVDLVMPCLSREWTDSPDGRRFVTAMLEAEDQELSRDPSTTHHVVAYGTLKSFPRLIGPLARYGALRATLAERARRNMRRVLRKPWPSSALA